MDERPEPARETRPATAAQPWRVNNPIAGAAYLVRGMGLIMRPGVRRYVVVPLLVNVVLFAGGIWLGADYLSGLVDRMLPGWLEWLRWVLVPLFVIVTLVVGFFAFNVLANLISAPFNGLLAEAIEAELGGRQRADGGWKAMLKELAVTMRSELRKALYLLVRAVPLLLLLWVPGVNVIASLLWMILGAWMMAVAYGDYPMANHGLDFVRQRSVLATHRWLALGFGGAVMFALAVPLLNFVVIPAAVAGATAMWVERLAAAAPTDASETASKSLRG